MPCPFYQYSHLASNYPSQQFLDHELKNADLKATEIVSGLKLEMDKIIASVSDIVDLDNWTLAFIIIVPADLS